jgi:hypothetical protein
MRSEWGARREGIRIEVLCLDYFRMGVRKLLRMKGYCARC